MKPLRLIPILAILLISCNIESIPDIKLLELSEQLIETHPDSALIFLNSIQFEEKFSDSQQAKYHLLKIKVKDKCYEDISSDTIIFKVKQYYISKNDKENITQSFLYSGLVLLEQGDNKKAMLEFLEAERYISGIDRQDCLKGLIQSSIAELFYQELLLDEAIKRFKSAVFYFSKSNHYVNEAVTYNQLGLCFLMKESHSDSASFYLQKGLEIADASNDLKLKEGFRQNLGLLYRENGKPDKAIKFFEDALNYTEDNVITAKIYYNIAKTYLSENNIDSAQHFINIARILPQSETDYHTKKYLNELESKILKSKGNYKQALSLNEEYLSFMEEEYLMNENKAILDIEKKYNYELIKNKHNNLLIKNQRAIIIFLALFILSIIMGISYYIKLSLNKKALEEADQKIIAFTDMVESYKQRVESFKQKNESFKQQEETFKSVLFTHFNILKKAALLEGYIRQRDREDGAKILKKFNEIIYGKEKLDWNILYDAMNNLHNGFLDSLYKTFPELDDEEFKICCLIYNDFSNTEISIICGLSNRSITARRSSIRKKIGIDDYGNINEFLKKSVEY